MYCDLLHFSHFSPCKCLSSTQKCDVGSLSIRRCSLSLPPGSRLSFYSMTHRSGMTPTFSDNQNAQAHTHITELIVKRKRWQWWWEKSFSLTDQKKEWNVSQRTGVTFLPRLMASLLTVILMEQLNAHFLRCNREHVGMGGRNGWTKSHNTVKKYRAKNQDHLWTTAASLSLPSLVLVFLILFDWLWWWCLHHLSFVLLSLSRSHSSFSLFFLTSNTHITVTPSSNLNVSLRVYVLFMCNGNGNGGGERGEGEGIVGREREREKGKEDLLPAGTGEKEDMRWWRSNSCSAVCPSHSSDSKKKLVK